VYKAEKDKLLDEMYQLDFEDIVAGMPTRFKYRQVACYGRLFRCPMLAQVEPQDYGLSTEEILLADDRDLKQYVSLKALAPYREGRLLTNPKRRKQLRQSVRVAIRQLEEAEATTKKVTETAPVPAAETVEAVVKKRRRKRKRAMEVGTTHPADAQPVPVDASQATALQLPVKMSQQHARSHKRAKFGKGGISVSRLQSYGI
jgi:protein KRI1